MEREAGHLEAEAGRLFELRHCPVRIRTRGGGNDRRCMRVGETAMKKHLRGPDIEILRKLAAGQRPRVPSPYRLRLELLGLVKDCADGLRLTEAGRVASTQEPDDTLDELGRPDRNSDRDAMGRRKIGTRKANFF